DTGGGGGRRPPPAGSAAADTLTWEALTTPSTAAAFFLSRCLATAAATAAPGRAGADFLACERGRGCGGTKAVERRGRFRCRNLAFTEIIAGENRSREPRGA